MRKLILVAAVAFLGALYVWAEKMATEVRTAKPSSTSSSVEKTTELQR